jgi:5-formyltetrahydrofolate cyclo-ligase
MRPVDERRRPTHTHEHRLDERRAMNSGTLKQAKREVRRRVLAAMEAMAPAERAAASRAISARFLALPEVRSAAVVMAFWSFGSEVDTARIIAELAERGTTIVLPRIVGGALEPRAWSPGAPTTPTSFGAREPADGEVVDPARIDVVATPAVVFDRTGRRVGYGGGFYDRFLPLLREDGLRVGIGFDLQVLPGGAVLPGGRFDVPVDVIVTERATIRRST